MAIYSTLTEVANEALGMIGEKEIGNVENSETAPARQVRARLRPAIREVQSMYPWQELTRRLELNPQTAEPNEEGNWRYLLPANCLTFIGFPLIDCPQWRMEGNNAVLASHERPKAEYIAYSENPAEWGAWLALAITTALAAKIAFPIAQNLQLARSLKEELVELVLPSAMEAEARARRQPTRRGGRNWRAARQGG